MSPGEYTLFTVFSQAQGSQKRVNIGAKMESPGTRNHKNPIEERSKEHKKHKLQRVRHWLHFD